MKYKIRYSDNIKEGFGGVCEHPFYPMFGTSIITIRPKYKNDIGLHNHEIKHAEQYSKNFFHNVMYRFSKKYRYKCELEAYREQIKTYKYKRVEQASWIIHALFSKYSLDINIDSIRKDVILLINKKDLI